jgi:hypothetical protein
MIDTGCNACNLKRVPDWEMPEQDAKDPRRRTGHATTGWRSFTSKVANLRGRDRVSPVAPSGPLWLLGALRARRFLGAAAV